MMFARDFRVGKTTTIHAAPERVLRLVDSLYMWHAWSASDRRHPMANRTYSGAKRGRGAVVSWDGGRMEIVDASTDRVAVALDGVVAEFKLEPEGEATRVTWSVAGQRPLFTNIDEVLKSEFEEGVENLRALAEA